VTAAEHEFTAYILDQLLRWVPVELRRLFGGHGIFRGGTMFALIHADRLYFRTDETNRGDFEALGMAPFGYGRRGKSITMGYHEVPPEVHDDSELLAEWAMRAFSAAQRRAEASPRARTAKRK
jgi:DNA transformation protein